ncbi:MAG: lytic transglycosylase domain-containing protein [Clostridia bacterium]|nr:lytic transglycosylase domain-containing protein [Clostridia bacterium]
MYKKSNKGFKYILLFVTAVLVIVVVINGKSQVLKLSYPMKYQELVNKYAAENDIDPFLVYAIIKAESGFDSDATSKKEARGLMQVTDETGQWGAKHLKIKKFNKKDLYDPDTNIKIGCWYIGWLMKQFDYELDLVIAAYNSGNGNVSKWLKNKEYSKSGNSLEKIPFKETDNYLKKVKNYYNVYKKLYEQA